MSFADIALPVIVALPFVGAVLPALTARASANVIAWAAAAVPLAILALLAPMLPEVFAGNAPRVSFAWLPALGLNVSLRLDGLAMLFALLIPAIGLLIILYARYYLSASDPMGRFFVALLLFMGAMMGIVLSDNLLLLVVFWELTSLTSFLLIGYWSDRTDSREGARMALAVTGTGGLALLGGALLLGHIAGTYEISEILGMGELIRSSDLYLPALLLILAGAFTKSAQFPFHFWLPAAMAAPTPVSAYLHSATMVKAGLFLVARLHPALAGSDAWFFLVGGFGLVTLVFGAYAAMFKHDLKGLLAYSTISHLGLIMLLLGMGTELAAVAAVFHIINHATFKASLFMAAGIIDHETGSRDMRRLGGLWKFMPYTAVLAIIAAASMAGVPLLNGFLSKEMFFAEALHVQKLGAVGWILPLAATAAGVFSVAYSVRFIHDVFFHGEPKNLPKKPHEPPRWMRIPVELLVAICLLVGILPQMTVRPMLDVAAGAVLGSPAPAYSLAIWHGFNLPLLMSVVALAGGTAVYFSLQKLYRLHLHEGGPWTGHRIFHELHTWLLRSSAAANARLANGSLQRYVAVLVSVSLVVGFAAFAEPIDPHQAVLMPLTAPAAAGWMVLLVATAVVVAKHRDRFTALVATGAVGLMVSAIFAYFSAPDLALTQLVVETASVILLVLVLRFLPQRSPLETLPRKRMRDIGLAALAGLGTGAAAWWLLTRPHASISDYFLANSAPLGGGTNVVNVILVDFRGFDTLGEVTVLALAALGVVAMLGAGVAPREGASAARRSVMLSKSAQILLPAAMLTALYIFLRGHNLPGGGFIAGLVAGASGVLLYVANGIAWSETRIRFAYRSLIGGGLGIAFLTGAGSWLFGMPFLTSTYDYAHLPVIGKVPLASAVAFDLGIFLTVVGVVMLMLSTLGRFSGDGGKQWKPS
ncbi:MAG: monovalent cation/H+ antiporter subunit A [Burkholderiales bacterium]